MASVSGLSRDHRIKARDRAVQAAYLAYNHRDRVHYTQKSRRWEGIQLSCNARIGEFPRYADCSAFVTWCLWNGLHLQFGVRDTVNGTNWRSGFTGTMLEHGKQVHHLSNVQRGDCIIYGERAPGAHTAIVVGVKGGTPVCISHGSEGGPYFVPYNYRGDILQIRRYI